MKSIQSLLSPLRVIVAVMLLIVAGGSFYYLSIRQDAWVEQQRDFIMSRQEFLVGRQAETVAARLIGYVFEGKALAKAKIFRTALAELDKPKKKRKLPKS